MEPESSLEPRFGSMMTANKTVSIVRESSKIVTRRGIDVGRCAQFLCRFYFSSQIRGLISIPGYLGNNTTPVFITDIFHFKYGGITYGYARASEFESDRNRVLRFPYPSPSIQA